MLTVSLRAQIRLAFENPHRVGLPPGDCQFRARHDIDTKAGAHLNVVVTIISIVVIIVLCELVLGGSLHGGRRATLKLPQANARTRHCEMGIDYYIWMRMPPCVLSESRTRFANWLVDRSITN